MKRMLAGAALALLAGRGAHAAAIVPVSYDMPNGQTGSYTYFDDAYTGSGNKGAQLAPLSGGLGDLTDGKFATDHWYNVSGVPYVGWYSISPVITFHFDQAYDFSSITLYVDNTTENQSGGVVAPNNWVVSDGVSTRTRTTSAGEFATISPNLGQTLDLTGFVGNTLTVTVNPVPGNRYFMISEAAFAGTPATSAAPEPGTWALMVAGFGMVGGAMRTRRTDRLKPAL